MSTRPIAFAELPEGAHVTVHSVYALGTTRREVLAELERAERFGLHVELANVGMLTGAENRERRTAAIKPLVAGRIIKNTPSTRSGSYASRRDPYIYIGDSIPNNHYDTGSRHTCWCGKTLGRNRILNETAEREIIADVLSNGGDVKAVAQSYGISVPLVTRTMKRYGYVRSSRARRTGVVAA